MKTEIKVKPLVFAGEIEFGMKRDLVRKNLGDFSEYKHNKDDLITVDKFKFCKVFYSKDDNAEFIMFHSLPYLSINMDGTILTDMTKEEIISYFKKLDDNLEIENYEQGIISIVSNANGVACYFTNEITIDEQNNEVIKDKVETISFAIKNYWKY